MIEVTTPGKYNTLIECCEQYISPTKYSLYNKVGGDGWEVSHNLDFTNGFCGKLKVVDESMATFILLKLK